MSNRLFQGIVHQMTDSIDRVIGVVDESGTVISCSELGKIGEVISSEVSVIFSAVSESVVIGGFTYKSFGTHMHADYAVFVSGEDQLAQNYASLLAISLSSVKQYYDEKYDRGNFIKNVILDNILPGDIYLKARELRFNSEASRAVFLIRIVDKIDVSVFEVIQGLFPDKSKDFVIDVNETDIALIKEVNPMIETKDLEKLARSVIDSLGAEFYSHVLVGIGTTVENIKDLARSFREAQVSLEVGRYLTPKRPLSAMTISVLQDLFISFPQRFVICSYVKCLREALLKALTRKRFSQFKNSLKTTLTFPRPQESFLFTETLLFTVLKKSKSSRDLTCVNLTTQLYLRLR